MIYNRSDEIIYEIDPNDPVPILSWIYDFPLAQDAIGLAMDVGNLGLANAPFFLWQSSTSTGIGGWFVNNFGDPLGSSPTYTCADFNAAKPCNHQISRMSIVKNSNRAVFYDTFTGNIFTSNPINTLPQNTSLTTTITSADMEAAICAEYAPDPCPPFSPFISQIEGSHAVATNAFYYLEIENGMILRSLTHFPHLVDVVVTPEDILGFTQMPDADIRAMEIDDAENLYLWDAVSGSLLSLDPTDPGNTIAVILTEDQITNFTQEPNVDVSDMAYDLTTHSLYIFDAVGYIYRVGL